MVNNTRTRRRRRSLLRGRAWCTFAVSTSLSTAALCLKAGSSVWLKTGSNGVSQRVPAACCCSAGHRPNAYRWTEPTLEHSTLLQSSRLVQCICIHSPCYSCQFCQKVISTFQFSGCLG